VIQEPRYLEVYQKDAWKKFFVRYLFEKEELRNLPRWSTILGREEAGIEKLRTDLGISDDEKHTVLEEELGIPIPAGATRVKIEEFPTPRNVVELIADPSAKKMLMNLYPEYRFLCSHVHVSLAPKFLKAIFDPRSKIAKDASAERKEHIFQVELAGPALWVDLLSVIQSCTELTVLYPADVELKACLTEAWGVLASGSLPANPIYELRAKQLLGVL
jgi:hypothetical protein